MDIIKKQKNSSNHQNAWGEAHHNKQTHEISDITTLDEYLACTKDYKKTLPQKKSYYSKGKIFFWISLVIFIFALFFTGSFFVYHANTAINNMSDGNEKHSFVKTISHIANTQSYTSLDGFDDDRINILLLGRANTHKSGKDLTDTIIIASINTSDYTIALLSLPRDLLISNNSFYAKINSLYQTGLRNDVGAQYITDSVQKITGQKIHYYFVLDFAGFTNIIDILGGINIDVPRHIKDERYPGPGYSYETFEVYPGLQKFDGTTALKYARTRHDDIDGDFGRAKRQQQVMQSARNKAFSLGTIMNPKKMTELFDVLGEHVHTNITLDEIEPFISLIKKVDTQNVTNVVVDAWKSDSLLISARQYSATNHISGLVPRIGNYKEIRDRADNIFTLEKIKQRQDEVKKENPKIILINATKNSILTNRVKKSLYILGFTNITIIKNDDGYKSDTTVSDGTGGTKPFSLDELLKKVPAKKVTATTNEEVDFIIILGNDIVDMYTYTEISQEELEQESTENIDR